MNAKTELISDAFTWQSAPFKEYDSLINYDSCGTCCLTLVKLIISKHTTETRMEINHF